MSNYALGAKEAEIDAMQARANVLTTRSKLAELALNGAGAPHMLRALANILTAQAAETAACKVSGLAQKRAGDSHDA